MGALTRDGRVDAGGAYAADRRVLHEGRPAVDEKWLLATWVWASAVQPEWGDGSIEALGGGERRLARR